MFLPTRIELSVGEQLVEFRCSRCRHVAHAWVSGTGFGLKVATVSVSNAELDARVGAAQAARLAPCPRCGHRNRAALAKVLLTGSVVGALAAFAAGLAAAEHFRGSAADGDVSVYVGVATFLAVVAAVTALKLWSVRRRVRFQRVVE